MALHLKSTGIDFADFGHGSGSMSSELMDDYEEGTWTATFAACTLGSAGQQGRYVKIGEFVMIWFDITGTLTSPSSGPTVTGTPFTALIGDATTNAAGYGAPVFRAATAMNSDFRVYGSSSYHSTTSIALLYYNSSGTEGGTSWTTGSVRLTGWSSYFTAT